MDLVVTLIAEGRDLQEGVMREYWTEARLGSKELPVMRAVARLLCAGRNRASRASVVAFALRANGGALPDALRPVIPVDGPEPGPHVASLEASGGLGLSCLFDIVAEDVPKTHALAVALSKMAPKDFDLSFFDLRAAEMAAWVKVGGLRAQWEWARRQPQLIGLGGAFWFQEIVLLRLGLVRCLL